MSRTKQLIVYPHLNDCKGDITKNWYIEYSFRLPGDEDLHKYRIYDNLCSGTARQRRVRAAAMIKKITAYLKSGAYLDQSANYNPVRPDDTHRAEQNMWEKHRKEQSIEYLVPRFLNNIAPHLRPHSRQDYRSKMKYFVEYMSEIDLPVTAIKKAHIFPFFEQLATEKDLCQRTIEKYEQIVRAFFNWCEDTGLREEDTNPVKRLPKFGKVIDCASVPYTIDERARLKEAIEHKEPFLWLACEIIYYCAIRPGTELRLLQVGMIDKEHRTITVPSELAKNKKTEKVGMPKELIEKMDLLGIFRYPANYYVFGKWGVPGMIPYGKNTMRNRFNYYRDQLGISKDRKFYSWKHNGAISSYDNGIPMQQLKEHLRHSSIVTTEEYIRKRIRKEDTTELYIDKL